MPQACEEFGWLDLDGDEEFEFEEIEGVQGRDDDDGPDIPSPELHDVRPLFGVAATAGRSALDPVRGSRLGLSSLEVGMRSAGRRTEKAQENVAQAEDSRSTSPSSSVEPQPPLPRDFGLSSRRQAVMTMAVAQQGFKKVAREEAQKLRRRGHPPDSSVQLLLSRLCTGRDMSTTLEGIEAVTRVTGLSWGEAEQAVAIRNELATLTKTGMNTHEAVDELTKRVQNMKNDLSAAGDERTLGEKRQRELSMALVESKKKVRHNENEGGKPVSNKHHRTAPITSPKGKRRFGELLDLTASSYAKKFRRRSSLPEHHLHHQHQDDSSL